MRDQAIPSARTILVSGPLPAGMQPSLVFLYRYWASLCPSPALPRPRDVDAVAMRPVLPWVLLLDVVEDDFRFRLVGEGVNRRYRNQLKGRVLRDLLMGDVLSAALEEHRMCVRHRGAVLTRNTEDTASMGDQQLYERLLLPLSSDGVAVDRLLAGMVFTQ